MQSHEEIRVPYIHEVRHDLCIVDLSILGIITSPLDRDRPSGLDEPTGECAFAKLGGLCGETKETAFLQRRND